MHSNGILKIIETADARSSKFDVDTSSLQPLVSSTNKLNSNYIDFDGTDLTTYLGYLQPSLLNYGDGNSAQLRNGHFLKGLTVDGFVNTTFNISDGTIVHSNGIMKIIETSDAHTIKLDVDTSSVQKIN